MADQDAADAAAQQRIVAHMQKDHHDSIARYLEHHHNLSAWTASSARMTAITLDSMTFLASGTAYTIPFTPPLRSYREARERVVAMDKESTAALHRSPITITTPPPVRQQPLFLLQLLIVLATFIAFSQRSWFAPGGKPTFLGPRFAAFCFAIQPWLFWGMVGIHGAELAWFVPKRLRRHSVSPRSGVFWAWAVAEFLGGVFTLGVFDGEVERVRREAEKRKH